MQPSLVLLQVEVAILERVAFPGNPPRRGTKGALDLTVWQQLPPRPKDIGSFSQGISKKG